MEKLISDEEMKHLAKWSGKFGCDDPKTYGNLVLRLFARLRACEDALRFYADMGNYSDDGGLWDVDGELDKGEKARVYFSRAKGEK